MQAARQNAGLTSGAVKGSRFRIVGVWVQLASVAAEEADLGMGRYIRIVGSSARRRSLTF